MCVIVYLSWLSTLFFRLDLIAMDEINFVLRDELN